LHGAARVRRDGEDKKKTPGRFGDLGVAFWRCEFNSPRAGRKMAAVGDGIGRAATDWRVVLTML